MHWLCALAKYHTTGRVTWLWFLNTWQLSKNTETGPQRGEPQRWLSVEGVLFQWHHDLKSPFHFPIVTACWFQRWLCIANMTRVFPGSLKCQLPSAQQQLLLSLSGQTQQRREVCLHCHQFPLLLGSLFSKSHNSCILLESVRISFIWYQTTLKTMFEMVNIYTCDSQGTGTDGKFISFNVVCPCVRGCGVWESLSAIIKFSTHKWYPIWSTIDCLASLSTWNKQVHLS